MKKYLALFLIPIIALSLASCKLNSKSGTGETTSQAVSEKSDASKKSDNKKSGKKDDKKADSKDGGTQKSVTSNFSKVLGELNGKETKLVDKLGKTEKGKKIVAFFGDEIETEIIVVEFKDGKVSKADDYRFYAENGSYESYSNAYKLFEKRGNNEFKVYKDEKCIQQNVTKQYRGLTYDDVYNKLKDHYNFK